MGQAFDRNGNVLGEEVFGDTKKEVFDKLNEQFKDAAEIRIRDAVARAGINPPPVPQAYDPPRVAPQRLSLDNVEHAFTYQPWNEDQQRRGKEVTAALIEAAKAIIRNVPKCPTRTRALNNLINGRMLANSAITHDGRY